VINLRPGVIAGDGVNGEPTRYVKGDEKFWFVYVHPEDVAQAVVRAVETTTVKYGTYYVVAGRTDSWFDWSETAADLGYRPEHNWDTI
jgi:nucleoside-diphosphate-sugar epimerase